MILTSARPFPDRDRIKARGFRRFPRGDGILPGRAGGRAGRIGGEIGRARKTGAADACDRRVELGQVDRIGAGGARGEIGDLALRGRAADRHAVGAIGQRTMSQRDAVDMIGSGKRTYSRRSVCRGQT